jgi:hypothetical protein
VHVVVEEARDECLLRVGCAISGVLVQQGLAGEVNQEVE